MRLWHGAECWSETRGGAWPLRETAPDGPGSGVQGSSCWEIAEGSESEGVRMLLAWAEGGASVGWGWAQTEGVLKIP